MVDVDVFPLSVTDELAAWKEAHERERMWFTLADAADKVEEADLRELMAATMPPAAASRQPAGAGA